MCVKIKSDRKKIAILGANGFLGRHTTRAAVEQGWEVHGIVRREEAAEIVRPLGANVFLIDDYLNRPEKLKSALKDCKALVNFANIVCGSPEFFKKINVEGSKAIIKAAESANVDRIVYPSGLGISEYNKKEWATNEYFKSKKQAEQIFLASKVSAIIFRPDYILGPGDELIPWIVEQIWEGEVIIAGDGKSPMQPLYVGDATKIFLAAASGIGEDNSINKLAGKEQTNMNELVDLIFKIIKKEGLNLPEPVIKHISYENAPNELNLCKELVDVMQCDLLPDGEKTAKLFKVNLTSYEEAVQKATLPEISINEKKKNYNAICLLSGGLDSTISLYWALKEGYKVLVLSIYYGYRPEKEIKAVKKICKNLNLKLIEVPLKFVKEATDLRFEGYPIPSAENAPQGFIPHKNIIFYTTAAYYADLYGCEVIIGGQISEDNGIFPDSNIPFFNSLKTLINNSKHDNDPQKIHFSFPLFDKTKAEAIKLGNQLNVPFELTWSCYKSGDEPCGKCDSCKKRMESFQKLGMDDPIY